jgi:alcohol dehydrogenase class IV
MISFDFQCPTRIVFGPGKLLELGAIAASLGVKRALVVSDAGIVASGHTQRGIDSLKSVGPALPWLYSTPSTRILRRPTSTRVSKWRRISDPI